MSRSRDVTLLILDDGETKEVKVRRGIVKNFNLIVMGTALFIVGLVITLFFFIYNYSYTQFVAMENQKLLIKNYELSQQIVSLNDSIENELGDRIDELDKANVLVDSIKKYLKNRGVSIENKLTELAEEESLKDKWLVSASNRTDTNNKTRGIYNHKQLSYLYDTLTKIPLGFAHIGRITSPFGYRTHPITKQRGSLHSGIDIAGVTGAPVKATADGIVTFAGTSGGYGRTVKIKHGYGYSTAYAHLSKIQVRNNQTVKAGDIIGNVGNSGLSTGSHLHYEIRYNDEPINPNPYLSLGN
ncbi:MAG: peptidoglycan DD-metalloendopeptidase family protein [Neisseriaceae bacterium]|nr:MAG: peptidoglycan DD-metalloendopeptidase family protein [Neisseriaceae bacterium]